MDITVGRRDFIAIFKITANLDSADNFVGRLIQLVFIVHPLVHSQRGQRF